MFRSLLLVALSFGLLACTRPPRVVTLLNIANTRAQLASHLEPKSPSDASLVAVGGYARLRTVLIQERARKGSTTFVTSIGDTFTGTGPAAWSQGEVVIAPINALGLDACVFSNKDLVVYGFARLADLTSRTSCHVLAADARRDAGQNRDGAQFKTIERGRMRVTFLGLADEIAGEHNQAHIDQARSLLLRELVRRVRVQEKPDLLVALSSLAFPHARLLARDVPDIDVIFARNAMEPAEAAVREGKTLIVDSGITTAAIGRLQLTLDGRGAVVHHSFARVQARAPDSADDSHVKQLVDVALAPYRERATRVVAQASTVLRLDEAHEQLTSHFTADAVREVADADIGVSDPSPFAFPVPAGPVTEEDLWNMLPLDVPLKRGWLTGRELWTQLDLASQATLDVRVSGLAFGSTHAEPANTTSRALVGGEPIRDDARYTLAGIASTSEPSSIANFKRVHDVKTLPMTSHQAVDMYLATHSFLEPTPEGDVIATEVPSSVMCREQLQQARRRSKGQ